MDMVKCTRDDVDKARQMGKYRPGNETFCCTVHVSYLPPDTTLAILVYRQLLRRLWDTTPTSSVSSFATSPACPAVSLVTLLHHVHLCRL